MRHRQHAREGILVLVLGLSAVGLGAVASVLAEPGAAARPATSPVVTRPIASAAGAMAVIGASGHRRDTAHHASNADRGPVAVSPGPRRAERVLPAGRLAVWSASYEPLDPRIELVHTASTARGHSMALLRIKQDWAELVGTGEGSLERSARPRELAESPGT